MIAGKFEIFARHIHTNANTYTLTNAFIQTHTHRHIKHELMKLSAFARVDIALDDGLDGVVGASVDWAGLAQYAYALAIIFVLGCAYATMHCSYFCVYLYPVR